VYLGIDIGTSSVKAVIVDDAQNIVAESSMPLSVSRPQHLWSEQDPADWWEACCKAVKALDAHMRSGIKAIGLSGQMHGATCLGANDKVLRPAILWNDGRSAAQCKQMMTAMPELAQITGNLAMPGFTAPKLQWMAAHEPDVFKAVEKVLLPKDYIRLKMCGVYASDMSDSAGTLWMDVAARDWSDDVLSLTGLARSHMPELCEGSESTGLLRQDIAQDWGMGAVPVAGGGGDNAAGAVGSGTIAKGEGFLSLGTSGVIFIADDTCRPNPERAVHTFCHALPELWHQMSVILSAASAVDFAARIMNFDSPAQLYELAQNANQRGEGALFLPYLSGERTPHNNPDAKGAFFGLTHEDTRETIAQAVLEGVAFALADGVEALRDGGADIQALSVIGGGARSLYWGGILSAAFGCTLHYRQGGTVGPAFGAARLARLCLGEARAADICTPPPIERSLEPDAELQAHYAQRRETFQNLYKSNFEHMKDTV